MSEPTGRCRVGDEVVVRHGGRITTGRVTAVVSGADATRAATEPPFADSAADGEIARTR